MPSTSGCCQSPTDALGQKRRLGLLLLPEPSLDSRQFSFKPGHLLSHLAAKALLPEKLVLDTARETVALFHQYWQAEKANLPLSTEVVQVIESHFGTIPLA